MPRIFLAIVGSIYLVLGIWCTVAPSGTANSVGFVLTPGSGESEFMTVYGGLELGLAWLFFSPLSRRVDVRFPLRFCLVLHAFIVAFRTAAFFRYSNFANTTYVVAGLEWLILIGALVSTRNLISRHSEPARDEA